MELRGRGVEAYAFDGARADPGLDRAVEKAEAIVVSIPPREGAGAALDRFASAIAAAPDLRRVVYYSTIGVYGDHAGAWVDETSPTRTRTARGLARLKDEARWTAAARARGIEADILRLAGIYGPGRNALINLREGAGAADRQAGSGLQPGPCRRHRRVHAPRADPRARRTGLERRRRRTRPAAGRDRLCSGAPRPAAAARGAVRRSAALPDDGRVLRRQQAGLDRQGQGASGICPRLSDLPRGAASSWPRPARGRAREARLAAWVSLACRRSGANASPNEGWKSLDFLGSLSSKSRLFNGLRVIFGVTNFLAPMPTPEPPLASVGMGRGGVAHESSLAQPSVFRQEIVVRKPPFDFPRGAPGSAVTLSGHLLLKG